MVVTAIIIIFAFKSTLFSHGYEDGTIIDKKVLASFGDFCAARFRNTKIMKKKIIIIIIKIL